VTSNQQISWCKKTIIESFWLILMLLMRVMEIRSYFIQRVQVRWHSQRLNAWWTAKKVTQIRWMYGRLASFWSCSSLAIILSPNVKGQQLHYWSKFWTERRLSGSLSLSRRTSVTRQKISSAAWSKLTHVRDSQPIRSWSISGSLRNSVVRNAAS